MPGFSWYKNKNFKTKAIMAQTGRFFKCLSHKGTESIQAKEFFKIGEIYAECDFDFTGQNLCGEDGDTFLLYPGRNIIIAEEDGGFTEVPISLYVSAMDFEAIENVTTIHLN